MTRPRRPAFAAPNEVDRNAPNEADRAHKVDCVDEADRAKPARQTKPGSRADRSQSRRSKSSRQKKLAHLSELSRWGAREVDLGRTPSLSVARGSRQTVESTVVGPSTATMSPPATGPMMARAIPWRGTLRGESPGVRGLSRGLDRSRGVGGPHRTASKSHWSHCRGPSPIGLPGILPGSRSKHNSIYLYHNITVFHNLSCDKL